MNGTAALAAGALGVAAGLVVANRDGVLGPKGCFLVGFLETDKEKVAAEKRSCDERRKEMALQGVVSGLLVVVVGYVALRSVI